MTSASSRSLDTFEREAEQNRAVLVKTVDALRASVINEVEDIRHKMSFDYIGTEVRKRVRANPLRSFAIGAGLSLPLWQMGRRIPTPLLLIGAGIALARPSTKNALARAASDASVRVGQLGTRSSDALRSALDGVKDAGSQVGEQVAAGVDAAQQAVRETKSDAVAAASDKLDAGSQAAADLASKGATLLQGGSDQLAAARDYADSKISQTRSRAADLLHDNPLLVAGAGLALGALLAAIMPATEAEGQLVAKVAPDLKQQASDVVDKGYETVRAAASDVYDGAVGRAKEHGLNPEGAQNAVSDLGERLGAVVDAVIGEHGSLQPHDIKTHS